MSDPDPAAGSARRGPGRPRLLSEAEIVDVAQALVRERGPEGLSMRNVARALGVSPMTLYGYVPNKEALDALLIDRVLSEVRIPGADEGAWDVRLRLLLCDARRTLVERPELTDTGMTLGSGVLQLLQRGVYGREATRLADGVLDLLRAGGFRPDDLHPCFVTLFTFVTGHVETDQLTQLPSAEGAPAAGPTPRPGDAIFAIGLKAVIEGLKAVFQPASPAPRALQRAPDSP